ncbi:MlaE family ABC transporter permease [Filimonas lacunae]|nr:ABC transporter permease [Filimonas lacunae]
MYWKAFMEQCSEIGFGAMPIVLIISFFLGAVTTVQTAYQLVSPLIPKTTISMIVRDTIMLELSPTVVCVVLAGVVGSKIASELGNMRVSEQIDAYEIMGINTKGYLIMPRVMGALVVIPALIILSMFLALLGGRIAGTMANILSAESYDIGLRQNFKPFNVYFSLIKTYTFAFLISSVSAYFGYYVKGGALEIGRASTTAVIVSCILILLADYLLAALLL